MHFNLDRMWELAREADGRALKLFHNCEKPHVSKMFELLDQGDTEGYMELRRRAYDDFYGVIRWRNMLMRQIFEHPDNPYSYYAIMSRVITGLSGRENELKAAA